MHNNQFFYHATKRKINKNLAISVWKSPFFLSMIFLILVGCDGNNEILKQIKSTMYSGDVTISEFLFPFTSETNSVNWKFDTSYRPENKNLVRVNASVPIQLGSRDVLISLIITWDKETEKLVKVVQNFGSLTDYGENFISMSSLSQDKQLIVKSCFYWFSIYNIMQMLNPVVLTSDTYVETLVKDKEHEILLPW